MNSAIEKYSPIDMLFSFTQVYCQRTWGNFLDVVVLLSYTLFLYQCQKQNKKMLDT
jgi:hypothetical protein